MVPSFSVNLLRNGGAYVCGDGDAGVGCAWHRPLTGRRYGQKTSNGGQ